MKSVLVSAAAANQSCCRSDRLAYDQCEYLYRLHQSICWRFWSLVIACACSNRFFRSTFVIKIKEIIKISMVKEKQENPAVTRKDVLYSIYIVPVAVLTFKVIQSRWFLSYLKELCDFLLLINSNLSLISHRLATRHPWQTDRQTDRRQRCQGCCTDSCSASMRTLGPRQSRFLL